LGRGAGSPSNTMWPGPRPTRVPSFILIHSIQPFGQNTPTSQTDRKRSDRANRFGATVCTTVRPMLSDSCLSVWLAVLSQPPNFWPTFFGCGQMAGWIKMPLGRKVGLDRSDIVRWGPSSLLPKRSRAPPIFSPCLLWPKGCMDQDTTWYEGRLPPRPHCVTWGLSSLQVAQSPNFRLMYMAKRSPISATA